jgi:hypothetical protein
MNARNLRRLEIRTQYSKGTNLLKEVRVMQSDFLMDFVTPN